MTVVAARPTVDASPEQSKLRVPDSPYKGLSYYTEDDAAFFFGREPETQVIVANLTASRLTLLYGESGVGKSSLLRAGVARYLNQMACENVARRGTPRHVTVVFPNADGRAGESWRDDPADAIAAAVARSVDALDLGIDKPPAGLPFDELLSAWSERLDSQILIILDQFEEYLLYHDREAGDEFADALARAVARPNLRVSILISIREDALARLDVFKTLIPTLFDNYLRIFHLDALEARLAIEGPIERYNEATAADPPFTVDPQLIDALLDELETGRVSVGVVGVGGADVPSVGGERRIETPYLQLVMVRLWREELRAKSRVLRLTTLERLGRSDRIVKTHLDETMKSVRRSARYTAARVFHHLVTPSGTKIAHSACDLADYVGLTAAEVEPVLEGLAAGEYRILRRVDGAGEGAEARFEIFHDVLAPAVLDWRVRYLRGREMVRAFGRMLVAAANLCIGIAWIVIAVRVAFAHHHAARAAFIAWGICALVVWVRTAFVLAARSRRRRAWTIPLIGIVASALGPITVAVACLVALFRIRARRLIRRRPAPRLPARMRRPERLSVDRARISSVAAAVTGAAIILAAGFLPTYQGSSSLFSANAKLWLNLVPLAAVTTIGALALLLLAVHPAQTRWVSGVFGGLGLAVIAFFFMLLGQGEQQTFSSGTAISNISGAGVYVGLIGGGLVAVAAAPAATLDALAALAGAPDGFVSDKEISSFVRARGRMRALARTPSLGFSAVAATAGGLLLIVGAFTAATAGRSLASFSGWLVVPPVALGVAAVLGAIAVGRRPASRPFDYAFFAALALTSFAIYGGYVGYVTETSSQSARYGLYVGISGAIALGASAVLGTLQTRQGRVSARPDVVAPTA